MSSPPSGLVPREGLVTLAHVIYALHAFSAVTGMLSPAFVVTAFVTGWPSIIAVILNYVKRSEVRGTWLDSHFSPRSSASRSRCRCGCSPACGCSTASSAAGWRSPRRG
jgi:hypothetical protein